jgi:hypothetical protein
VPQEQEPFEPVLLNLDTDTYVILTSALRDFAEANDHQAEDERQRALDNDLPETASNADSLRLLAEQARALILDVEGQIDANSAAHRSTQA